MSFNTSVIICGCSAKASPVGIVPPLDTPLECLVSGPAEEDDIAFRINTGWVTCHTDVRGNPNQDCLNAMVALCSSKSSVYEQSCSELVASLAKKSENSNILYWSKYLQYCFIMPNQDKCNSAAKSLRSDAYLSDISAELLESYSQELSTGYITEKITDGIKMLLR